MDAKPQRFGRPRRALFLDENAPVVAPNKVLHQRFKSTGALAPIASNIAAKGGANDKRAPFNDRSNITKPVIRDDSGIGTKSPGLILDTEKGNGPLPPRAQSQAPSNAKKEAMVEAWLAPLAIDGVAKDTSSVGVAPLATRPVNRVHGSMRRDTAVYKDGDKKPKTGALAAVVVRQLTAVAETSTTTNDIATKDASTTTLATKDAPVVAELVTDITTENPSKPVEEISKPVIVESKVHADIVVPVSDAATANVSASIDAAHDEYAKYLREFEAIRAKEQAERESAAKLKRELQEREEHLQKIAAEREAEREARERALRLAEAEAEAEAKARRAERYGPTRRPAEAKGEETTNLDEDGYDTTRSIHSPEDYTTGGPTVLMAPKVTTQIAQELATARETVESSRTLEQIEDDYFDTSMVAEYGPEIFTYMGQLEAKMVPNAHYMDTQTELQWSMRAVLIDWLIQVHGRFNMLPETLFLSVNYIDRFLSVKVVSMGKLQLVGATALLIAAKYEEINSPSLAEMVYMVDGGYTHDEIVKAERFMLSMLQFELGWPGPMSFLRRISKADEYDLDTRTLAKYFLEATLIDERFVACPPSFMAAGAHCLARFMLKKGDWSSAHIYYSNYTYVQLRPLVTTIVNCLEAPQRHHLTVYEKYSDKKFKRAAVYAEREMRHGFQLPYHPSNVVLAGCGHVVAGGFKGGVVGGGGNAVGMLE